eukprot:INCI9985.1.p1 GENE.INCI9985.1~~INCI9985.1.p1  ORF type:complete len:1421 (-),score=261.98 INCI9985.1:2049-6188(-)
MAAASGGTSFASSPATAAMTSPSSLRPPFGFKFGAVPQGSDGEARRSQSGMTGATDPGSNTTTTKNNDDDDDIAKYAVGVSATTDADTGTRCYSLKASQPQVDSVLSLVPDADEKGRNLLFQIKPLSKAAGISLLLSFACHEGFVADATLDTDAGDHTVVLGPCEPEDILEYEDLASDSESDAQLPVPRDETSARKNAGSQEVTVQAETSPNDDDDNDEWEWEGEEADTDAGPIATATASEADQQTGQSKEMQPDSAESEDETDALAMQHHGRHLRMSLQVGKWNNLEVNLAALARGVFGSRFERCLGIAVRLQSIDGENSCLVRSNMRFRSTRGRGTKLDLMRKLEGEAFKYKDSRQVSLVDSHDIDFGDLHFNGGQVHEGVASAAALSSGSSTLKYAWSQSAGSCDVYFAAPSKTVSSNVSVRISSEREGASLRVAVFGKEIFAGLLANSVELDPCPEKSVEYNRWNVIHQPRQVHKKSQVFVHVAFRKKSVAPAVGCWWAQVFENEQGFFKDDVVDHVDDMVSQADSDNDDDSDDFNLGSPAARSSSSQQATTRPEVNYRPGWCRYDGAKIDVDRRVRHPEDNPAAALEAMFPFLELDLQLKVLAMFHARRQLPTCGRALAALIRGPVQDKSHQFRSAVPAVVGPAARSPFWAVRSAAAILRASASTKAATRVWSEQNSSGRSVGCEFQQRASRDLYMTPPSLGFDLDVDVDAVQVVLNAGEGSKTSNLPAALPQLIFGPARSDVLKVTQLTMEALPHDYGCLWGLSDVEEVKLGAGTHKIGGNSFSAVCGGTTAANICCRVASSTRVFGPGVQQAVSAVKPFEANSELSATPEGNVNVSNIGGRGGEKSSAVISAQHQDAKQQRFSEQKIRRAGWMKALTTLQSLLAQTGQVLKRCQSLKSHARVLLGTKSLQRLDELAAELNLELPIASASQSHAAMIRSAQARLATTQPSAAQVASLLEIGKSFIGKFPKSSSSLVQLVRQLTFLGVDNNRGYDVEYDVEDEDSDSDDDDIEFECLVQEKFVRRPRVEADSESRLSQANGRKRGGARLTGGRRKRNTASTIAITDTRSGNHGQDATETVALSTLSTQAGANSAVLGRPGKVIASRHGSQIEATALCKGDAVEVNILRTPRDHAKAKYELVVGESQREQHDVPRSCLRRSGADAPVSLGEPLDVGDEVEVESRKTAGKWRKAVVMGRSDLGKRKGNRGDWRSATVVRVRSSACLLARRSIFAAHFSLLRGEIEHVTMALVERINKTTGGSSTVLKAIEGANIQLPAAKSMALAINSQSSPTMVALTEAIDALNNAIAAARSFQEALDRFKSAPKGAGNTPPALPRDLLQVFGRMVRHDKDVLRTLTAAARTYMSGDGALPRVNS